MELKKVLGVILLLTVILSSINFASAITGSIGNARMILRPDVGEQIEKYILVKNVNDVAVDIELFTSGDLEEDINIVDSAFRLEAGEEKRAYFTIDIKKSGSSETSVNVQFTPVDGKNGVGLSSTVIVIATGEDIDNSEDNEEKSKGVSLLAIGFFMLIATAFMSMVMSPILILIILAIITVILIFILSRVMKTKPKKKSS